MKLNNAFSHQIILAMMVLSFVLVQPGCKGGADSRSGDSSLSPAEEIEQSLSDVASQAQVPPDTDPATAEENLNEALLKATSDLLVGATTVESASSRAVMLDLVEVLDRYRSQENIWQWLKNLTMLDLDNDCLAERALDEFVAKINALAVLFGGVHDIENISEYSSEILDIMEYLTSIIDEISTLDTIVTLFESIPEYIQNYLNGEGVDLGDYGLLSDIQVVADEIRAMLVGELSCEGLPNAIDEIITLFRDLAAELRKNPDATIQTAIPLPMPNGINYYYTNYAGLASYLDGYRLLQVEKNGQMCYELHVDESIDGGLVGFLLWYRARIGSYNPPANAQLSHMAVSAGTLSPVFDADTLEYRVIVPNNVASITVTPASQVYGAITRVNGAVVKSGTPSSAVSLEPGIYSTITIHTIASDGTSERTYTVLAKRLGDNNATLSNLVVSNDDLAPSFDPVKLDYFVSLENEVTSISVIPVAAGDSSSIYVNGVPVPSGTESSHIPLAVGANLISVEVAAGDETTICTYTITAKREGSHNALLSDIGLSSGMLSPAFNADTMNYTLTVDNDIQSMAVTPVAAGINTTILVNNMPVVSGAASAPIALNVGTNLIDIAVTAEDKTTLKKYSITITRLGSHNANLASLGLSSGTLSPAFAQNTVSYSVEVDNPVTSIKVIPAAEGVNTLITVNNVSLVSGSVSAAINLPVGTTQIVIKITAEDRTTVKTYTVSVKRLGAHNAFLTSMAITNDLRDESYYPSFNQNNFHYDVYVKTWYDHVHIRVTSADPKAKIRANGSLVSSGSWWDARVPYGTTCVEIEVTAEDGYTMHTYEVHIERSWMWL